MWPGLTCNCSIPAQTDKCVKRPLKAHVVKNTPFKRTCFCSVPSEGSSRPTCMSIFSKDSRLKNILLLLTNCRLILFDLRCQYSGFLLIRNYRFTSLVSVPFR